MSTPVGGRPPDPFEKYRVEEIQRDKRKNEAFRKMMEEPEAPEKKGGILAYFLNMLRKIVDLFIEGGEKGISETEREDVVENLTRFKEDLEILKKEDRSQDTEFLARLANHWRSLLEDSHRFKRTTPLAAQFKLMIQKIKYFPEKEEHTLGYYLTEYGGEKWIPFPFMELIQKIHRDHEKNPTQSALSEWTRLIQELSNRLKM